MLNKTSRFFLRSTVLVLAVVTLSCTYLVIRERQTLALLVDGGVAAKPTEVYARWLTLQPGSRITAEAVLAELKVLDYVAVPGLPQKPGEFQNGGDRLIVYSRGFRYPDKEFPAQAIQVHFAKEGLRDVSIASGGNVPEWRLEPKRLARWGGEEATSRYPVKLSELPPHVPQAVIAVEDKRFFSHGALDLVGLGRAVFVDLRHGRLRQGGSTISQQLARSIFLDVNRTLRRKVLEAGLAIYLEARYTKPQLLEMYLNQVYWGQEGPDNLLGIEAASRSYFGKPARQLTIAEAALLAGMLRSPNRLSPRMDLKASVARQKVVLGLMRDQERITLPQFSAALGQKIVVPSSAQRSNDAAYFLALLHDELGERYSLPLLVSQGWKIFTTLDPVLQSAAMSAVASLPAKQMEGALVALDPASGAVRAWVGGTSYQSSPFDRAINAHRQPGSAFKPFVVLAALESRSVTTVSMLEDKPLVVTDADRRWAPQNYDRQFRGNVSVWDSLVHSYNIPMVKLAMATGLDRVADTAHRAGIESSLRAVPSLALGTSEVKVVELTSAYGTLASGGLRTIPYDLEAIMALDGTIVELHENKPERVFEPNAVYLVTQMLQAVLREGTGKSSHALGFNAPAAGKTGTSENYQDAWFVGYTPDLVTGVWIGYDIPKSLGRSAAGIALPIWTKFMITAVKHYPAFSFETPKDLVKKTIDLESGLLARSGCPTRREMAFLPGGEPTEYCPIHAGGIVGFFQRWRRKP